MGMKEITIELMDFRKRKTKFTIKDLDDVLFAKYELLSGDETLSVYYKDQKEVYYDSCTSWRMQSYHEHYVILNKDQLEIFSKLEGKNTYRRAEELEKIDKWKFEKFRAEMKD